MNANTLSLALPGQTDLSKGRVLCVDDEPNILRALSWLLRKDFTVVTAASAREGLELIRKGDFDVVISDQRMPEMSGVDFLNQVRELTPRAMRILLTGYSDLQAVLRSVNESEIFRFVTKPWDVNELPEIVAQAAGIARRQGHAPTPVATAHPELAGTQLPKMLVLDEEEATHSAVEMSAGDLAQIVHVTNPIDALKLLDSDDIGVILSERKLGTMDLTHLLCLLKRKHPQIVSVVITDSEDSSLICRMINQGQIYRFITKPIKAGNLRLTLKSALSKRSELLGDPQLAERHRVADLSDEQQQTLESSLLAHLHPAPGKAQQTPRPTPESSFGRLGGLFRRLFGA